METLTNLEKLEKIAREASDYLAVNWPRMSTEQAYELILGALSKVATFESLHIEYLAWVKATFPDESTEDQWRHLKEEFVELESNFNDRHEYADVFMLLCCVANGHGIDLIEAVRTKFELNKARDWELTARGYRHVADDGPSVGRGNDNVLSPPGKQNPDVALL